MDTYEAKSELRKIIVKNHKGILYLKCGTIYYTINSPYSEKKFIDSIIKCFHILRIHYVETAICNNGFDQINLRTLKESNQPFFVDLTTRHSKMWGTVFADHYAHTKCSRDINLHQKTADGAIAIVCPICLVNKANSDHHIMPKSAGGSDSPRNKVRLCKSCHDIVESLYDEFGLLYSPDLVTKIRLNYINAKVAPLQYLEVHVNEN